MFASEEIADVHFHDRTRRRAHGIGNDDGGVCVGACVEYDAGIASGLGDVVRQAGLVVLLHKVDVRIGELLAKFLQVFFKGEATIHIYLPGAELAEVDTIDNQTASFVRPIHR